MTSHDILGFLAAGLVLLTFCMPCLRSLRLVALASNCAFIAYGWAEGLVPVLALHALLIPVNLHGLMRASQKRGFVK